MTVATEAESSTRAWTGVETVFAGGFSAQSADHVKVTFTDAFSVATELIGGVHYQATLDGAGAVTVYPLALPPAPGSLLIYRKTPALQQTDFVNLASYSPAIHTSLHDAAALRDQELAASILRTLRPINGWSAIPALVADGARIVLQIVAWTGGEGTPPASGQYVGATGLVAAIADAVNLRGSAGAGTGDVIGPAGGMAAMQFAFYADATGKLLGGGATLTPAQLTASVSDYNPASLATAFLVRLSANNPWNITGLAGATAQRPLILLNTAAPLITLTNQDAASAAANRFNLGGNVVLAQDESIFLIADPTSSRWRRVAGALPNASVKARHIGAGEIATAALADGSVTPAKLGGAVSAALNTYLWHTFR